MHEPHETFGWGRDGPVRTEEEDLLKRAETDPYRLNAFRLAELPVDASPREIRSRMDLVAMAAKARHPIPPGPCRVLPLREAPALDDLQEAARALQSPERRLVEELFWFWARPGGRTRDDPALQALARGDRSQAVELWAACPNLNGNRAVALHNRAVLHHLEALALEEEAPSRALDANEAKRRDECWREAILCWNVAFENDGVWQSLHGRVRELSDARVTEETVRSLREALPRALVAMNVRHALKAADRNSFSEVQRQAKLLGLWNASSQVVREALKRASEPVRRRIEALCEEAKAETAKDPLQAETSIGRLLMRARPFLVVLDALLPSGHPIREGTHDDVVETALSCQLRFAEKGREAYADDHRAHLRMWQASETVLELAIRLEGTEAVGRRLAENLEVIRKNTEILSEIVRREELAGDALRAAPPPDGPRRRPREPGHPIEMCWFCKSRKALGRYADEVPLYRVTERVRGFRSTKVHYQRVRIPVPRCPPCQAAHAREKRIVVTGGILGAVVGVLALLAGGHLGGGLVLTGGLGWLLGSGLGAVVSWSIRRRGTGSSDLRKEFPPVWQALAEGWSIGEEPSG